MIYTTTESLESHIWPPNLYEYEKYWGGNYYRLRDGPKVTVLHKEDWESELDLKGEGSGFGWGSGFSWGGGYENGFGHFYGEGQGMGHESGHGFGYGYAMGESWNGTGYVPDCGG